MGILRFCITFTVRKSRKSENKKSIGIKRIREELRMSGISLNIRYVMGCLLLLFAMGCRAEAAEAENADAGAATLQQTTQYAELKEAPDAKSSTLEKLDEGTAVIVEETEGAWSRVRYKEKEGYLPNGALDSYDVGPVEELNREFREVGENNVGNCEIENSSRWIFAEGIKRSPNFAALYSSYSYLEISQRCATKARTILRQSLQYSDFVVGELAILEFCFGNIDSDNIYCTRRLMDRMESQKAESFSAMLHLYYCALLLRQKEKSEQYHQLLLQNPNYNPNNKRVEKWIQLCTEAVMAEKA